MQGNKVKTRLEQISMQPAFDMKAGFFYALSPEMDEELGCIGHVRIDFRWNGYEMQMGGM